MMNALDRLDQVYDVPLPCWANACPERYAEQPSQRMDYVPPDRRAYPLGLCPECYTRIMDLLR